MKKNRLKKSILVDGKSIMIDHSFNITQYLKVNRHNRDIINLYFFKKENYWYFVIGYDHDVHTNVMYSAVYSMCSFDCPKISSYLFNTVKEIGFETLYDFKSVIKEAMEALE